MPSDISEKGLEAKLANYLQDHHGYEEGVSSDYNKKFGLDTNRVKRFILSTQKEKADNTSCFASQSNEQKFFKRLSDEIGKRGITDVLRKGCRYLTEIFDLYYPIPSELNPNAQDLYDKNIFCVTRQLYYSEQNNNSIDVYITLNGLPVMTMEMKNHFTNQTVDNAVKQYEQDRNPKEDPALILQKRRLAVYFAVDDDQIKMCTELKGKNTRFLPFNKGVNGGAGNPINPNGVRTAYFWEDILSKRSLSDILENYAQITYKEKEVKDKGSGKKEKRKEETIIWPRYHQLDAVRKLITATKDKGVGQRFLIQHSAGSGKSNSITWLAYQLVGLIKGSTPILDSVIVVTDRVNLDNQIKKNITSFKRLSNLVEWADSSQTLKNALEEGKKIIITIVHKFPYILDAIGSELKDKHFGIIIDEAHSSQNGSLSAKMNIALSGNAGNDKKDTEDILNKIIAGRKMVKNANYYAFTATPKNKTLQMFGTPDPQPDGTEQFKPFHEYTMKQAIEEGFIMDVLKNYTTYSTYYKLIKKTYDDPIFDNDEAKRKLRAIVEGNSRTIKAKAEIIVSHFHTMVIDKGKIGGQARAMVVTSSIDRAIKYYFAIQKLLVERKSPYKAIVAFSGSKEVEGRQATEADLNGFPSNEIEEKISEDPYRIFVVANKFQTGYDQPLLHTMYVDKELSDVAAVQTLSRLNRIHPLKHDTFVLDFYNDSDKIAQSFQRYYKTTILSEGADPNKLNDLITIIEAFSIYTEVDVSELNNKFLSNSDRDEFEPIINKSVERFKLLDDDDQIKCKSSIKSFVRTYPFIAAVTPLYSKEWEKLYIYYSLLVHKLPILKDEDFTEGLRNYIDIDQLQVTKISESNIALENSDATIDPLPVSSTTGGKKEHDLEKLSEILRQFNDIHWHDEKIVKEQIDSLPERLMADQTFANAVKNSNMENAQKGVAESLMRIVISMTNDSAEFCRNYFDNTNFKNAINEWAFHIAYNSIKQSITQ